MTCRRGCACGAGPGAGVRDGRSEQGGGSQGGATAQPLGAAPRGQCGELVPLEAPARARARAGGGP